MTERHGANDAKADRGTRRDERSIRHWMTPEPRSIGSGATLASALRLMTSYSIRHMPVVDRGELVGVLSDRDIAVVQSIHGVDLNETTVAHAMTEHVHCTSPNDSVRSVVARMADQKVSCAVITTGKAVVGIFTTADALEMLAHYLPA